MKVFWTKTAENHLDAILSYISLILLNTQNKWIDRITRRSIQIADFPLSGRKVPEYEMEQIREIFEGYIPHHLTLLSLIKLIFLAVIIRVRISKVNIQIKTLIFAEPAH